MLNMDDVRVKFGSLQEYEEFHKEWASACYLLNPTEKNKKELESSKKALVEIGDWEYEQSNVDY